MSLFARINVILLALFTAVTGLGIGVGAEARRPIRQRANSEMKIALTFDDGPSKKYTDEILDILDEFGIKATFFVIGKCCNEAPEQLKRAYESGHEIGNHTYSHGHTLTLKDKEIRQEIRLTEETINGIIGCKPVIFRPPEGAYSSHIGEICEKLGYRTVLWSVDTCEWRRPSAEEIAKAVMENTASGSIILCHDNVVGKSNTPEALRIFIPKLLRQGYEFVTVSELIAL